MRNKRFSILLIVVISILLIPFVAMQFTNEVNWTISDFMVAGILLFGCAIAIEFVFRKLNPSKHKIVFAVIIVLLFLLVWAELAVGIFGTPFAGQ